MTSPDKDWIPIAERMPEEGEMVLCWQSGAAICAYWGPIMGGGVYWSVEKDQCSLDTESSPITHWMPLPEPPDQIRNAFEAGYDAALWDWKSDDPVTPALKRKCMDDAWDDFCATETKDG